MIFMVMFGQQHNIYCDFFLFNFILLSTNTSDVVETSKKNFRPLKIKQKSSGYKLMFKMMIAEAIIKQTPKVIFLFYMMQFDFNLIIMMMMIIIIY